MDEQTRRAKLVRLVCELDKISRSLFNCYCLRAELSYGDLEDKPKAESAKKPVKAKRKRRKATQLRVTFNRTGDVVFESTAKGTFIESIKRIGAGRIMQLMIPTNKMFLIDGHAHPLHPEDSIEVESGMYLFCGLSNEHKKKLLDKVASALGEDITVELL